MLKRRLFTPGPVPVPERVRLAMAQEILHHRSADFVPLFQRCKQGMQRAYQTKQPVLMLSSSGTGAMDAAVSNLMSPGEHALVVRGGKFGERWAEICQTYGVRPTCIDVEWGRGVDPAEVRRALDANRDVRALFVTASETSTGACHPLPAIAEIVRGRDDVLFVVDGITAVGVYDVGMDALGIDALVAGSQKAFMMPPGLAFLALSERAWARQAQAKCPRFYFDLAEELAALEGDQTAWTPAVSLLIGLDEALKILLDEEGLEATWRRTAAIARATREAMRAIGLELYAPDAPSPACTAVKVPAGVDGPRLRKLLRDGLGFTLADGQGKAKGKIFRIAHLGYFDAFDTLGVIAAVELALTRLGFSFKLGEGVRTALELLRDEA
jgi:aspartate aminotransferase-like enzyme